jgi:inosose dehydratase
VADLGFRYFDTVSGLSMSRDVSRRYIDFGYWPNTTPITDTDLLLRLSAMARAAAEDNLHLAGLYVGAEYINPYTRDREIAQFRAIAHILKGFGTRYLIVGGGPPTDGTHTEQEYRDMAESLAAVARICQPLGVQLCYHPHLDTFVQNRDELDRFCHAIDPELVNLCIDAAHLTVRGADAVEVVSSYADRIRYVHFKDVKGDNVTELHGRARYETFTELGTGYINYPRILEILLEHNFDGPVIIEQDVTTRTPRESAEMNRAYARDTLGLTI